MERKTITKEKVIGMQVINSEANLIGVAKDVSFAIGETKMYLVVELKDGKIQDFPWEDIQAVGDFILLKPKIEAVTPIPTPATQTTQPICPTCGKPLTYIQQYKRWYCYNEKKYV
ncbi:MAG: PRC-barrel domain-containing protein [Nitrososphaerales archaeon]